MFCLVFRVLFLLKFRRWIGDLRGFVFMGVSDGHLLINKHLSNCMVACLRFLLLNLGFCLRVWS